MGAAAAGPLIGLRVAQSPAAAAAPGVASSSVMVADDAAAAAKALVTLAAEAELQQMPQAAAGGPLQHVQHTQQQPLKFECVQHQQLPSVDASPHQRSLWQHNSSSSSQSPNGGSWVGMQPAGQPGLDMQQGRGRDSSQGEFLPWEQLLSGIQAIKMQGPPLFMQQQQQQQAGNRSQRQEQQGLDTQTAVSSDAVSVRSGKFCQLLQLVGRAQPAIQRHVQAGKSLPLMAWRSQLCSRNGSSSSSSSSCELPLFQFVAASRHGSPCHDNSK